MLTPYREIPAAELDRTRAASELLHAAAETAVGEGRWRPDDLSEYVLGVARQHELHVWPTLLRRVCEAVGSSPSTA
jgi:hypothetical protein